MKNKIMAALRVSISFLLIILLLYIMRDKYGEIASVLKGTNIHIFVLAQIMYILAIALASLRLRLVIQAQEICISFADAVSLTFIGYFFNNFLPTTIGGDVVKGYYVSGNASERMNSFVSVFVDRIIGLFTMIFMAFIALFFVDNGILDRSVKNMIYILTAFSILAVIFMANQSFAKRFSALLLFARPIEERLKRAYSLINGYRHHKLLMLESLVISIVSQLLYFASIGIMAFSIGTRISVMDMLLRMPIVNMMSLLPSINGLGLREGSTVLLFGPLIGRENAFAISILWLLTLLVMSVLGGIIYTLSPQFKIRFKQKR